MDTYIGLYPSPNILFKKRFGNWLWFWDQVREYESPLKPLEFSADISHKLNNMKHTLLWLLQWAMYLCVFMCVYV